MHLLDDASIDASMSNVGLVGYYNDSKSDTNRGVQGRARVGVYAEGL